MVIYAESSAVEDPLVLKDEKFAAVRSQICIFKEGELWYIENKNRIEKFKGMSGQRHILRLYLIL